MQIGIQTRTGQHPAAPTDLERTEAFLRASIVLVLRALPLGLSWYVFWGVSGKVEGFCAGNIDQRLSHSKDI